MLLTVLGWLGLFFGGLLIGLLIVLLIKVKAVKKTISVTLEKRKSYYKSDKERIEQKLKTTKKKYKKQNRFHVIRTVLGFKAKKSGYIKMYGDIINEVAKLQNPDSQKPFLEFTAKQAFDFVEKVTVDFEEILNSLDMPMLKNMDVSTIYGVVDVVKKVSSIKPIRGAKKISEKMKPIFNALKILNPVKFTTTLITAIFTASLKRDLIFALADVVALEFSEFYARCKSENVVEIAS